MKIVVATAAIWRCCCGRGCRRCHHVGSAAAAAGVLLSRTRPRRSFIVVVVVVRSRLAICPRNGLPGTSPPYLSRPRDESCL